MKNEENKLLLAFDYRFFFDEIVYKNEIDEPIKGRKALEPGIIKCSGIYEKNKDEIKKILKIPTIAEIVKVLSIGHYINFKEIEKIINITHPTMWEHIDNLEYFKIVIKEKKKNEGERREFKINLHPNIKVSHLFIYEAEEYNGENKGLIWTSSNLKSLKEMGLKNIKTIVDDKNVNEVINSYTKEIMEKLKSEIIIQKQTVDNEIKSIQFKLKS